MFVPGIWHWFSDLWYSMPDSYDIMRSRSAYSTVRSHSAKHSSPVQLFRRLQQRPFYAILNTIDNFILNVHVLRVIHTRRTSARITRTQLWWTTRHECQEWKMYCLSRMRYKNNVISLHTPFIKKIWCLYSYGIVLIRREQNIPDFVTVDKYT